MKNVVIEVAFTVLTVMGLSLAGPSDAVLNLETAVGIWLFDEPAGIDVIDSSGNENHGTFADGAQPKRIRNGKFRSALEFDGKDDFIRISHSDSFSLGDKISISVWVYPDGLQPWTKDGKTGISGGIMEKKDHLGWLLKSWEMPPAGGEVITWHFSLAGTWSSKNGMVVSGRVREWQHIGCVYDGKQVKFYLNGELKASNPQEGRIQSARDLLTIGMRLAGDHSAWFKGMIDDVGIFNAALTEEEVAHLMDVGLGQALEVLSISPGGELATTWGSVRTR